MKKHMLNLIAVFALFVLSACGGGGGTADTATSSTSVVPSSAVSLSEAGGITFSPLNATAQSFSLQVSYVKNLNDNYLVSVDTQSIEIAGCTIVPGSVVFSPSPVVMDGNTNSKAALTITGQVDSACTNTSDYTLTGDVAIKLGDQTTHEVLSVSSSSVTNPTNPTDPTASNYLLTNETSLTVTAPSVELPLTVDVVDAATGVAVPGVDVNITNIPIAYGTVGPVTVKTNEFGRAQFTYTAPSTLISGSASVTLSTVDPSGATVTKAVTITTIPPAGGGTQYSFINATDLTITAPSVTKDITVDLINSATGVGVSGESVSISVINSQYGSISPATTTTDAAGRATFTYTAPEILVAGSATATLSYTDTNGITITQPVTITVAPTSAGGYTLTNATTPIEVNYNDEIKTISAVVIDGNGVGVQDVDVSITALADVKYGAIISASTVKTDQSGRATFTYKSPADIAAVNDENTSVTIFLNNDTSVNQNITISFSKVDENVTVPLVVIANNYKEVNLTQNSQNVEIEVQVFEQGTNIPYTQGNVKVSLPDNVLDGVDVGSFTEYSVAVGTNGKAIFNYTGPQDLQALIDDNETSATFKFFHEANPTQIEEVVVMYDLQAGYIPANYILTTSSADGKQTMNLNVLKTFTLYLKDDQGILIDDADINTITLTTQNEIVGKLVDSDTGSEVTTLSFTGTDAVNSKSFSIKTNTLSGLLPIKISVDFTDANGAIDSREVTMNVVVLSGPPTAMSISYVGVEQNATVAKYTEKFVVTVTDAYNNPVNTKPYIATGAIVEYAVDGSSVTGERTTTSPRLWHGTEDPRGTIGPNPNEINKAEFNTTVDTFNHIDIDNDRLVVFGAGYVYEVLGKWDISSFSNTVLELKDDFYCVDDNETNCTIDDLGFAVGHNNRQDLCSGDQREYVGNMKSSTYQIDDNGHALIEFEYDYHLTGKDIMVWVNLSGLVAENGQTDFNLTRIGEAQKHTLRGAGFISNESYTIPAGGSARVSFKIHHKEAPEWYRNGHFGYAFNPTACTVTAIVDSSNMHDARDCNNTIGYVVVDVSNYGTQDCTIELNDESIAVAPEFNSGLQTVFP